MLIERERYPPVSFAYPIVLYECVLRFSSCFFIFGSWSSTDSLCVNGSWFHLALVFAVVKNLKLNWIEIVLSSTSLLKRRQWLKELLSFSVQAYCHLQLHDRLILFSSFYQGQATWKVGVTSHIHNHMKTLYFLCFNLLNFDISMIIFFLVENLLGVRIIMVSLVYQEILNLFLLSGLGHRGAPWLQIVDGSVSTNLSSSE